jgi:hypothetical protein
MHSYLLANAIAAFLGFLINGAVLFLVLSRGRQKYHYLFATILALYAIGDLGFFIFMIRNSHADELLIYMDIISQSHFLVVPCIYHFICRYLNQPRKKSIIFIWALMVIALIHINTMGRITSPIVVTRTEWGNYWAFAGGTQGLIGMLTMFAISLAIIWSACWFLFRARQRETSPLSQRHILYILISFLVSSFLFLTLFLMPTKFEGIWIVSIIRLLGIAAFGALIGIAIIKERLFDITVIIKKTTIYSILLALVIFIFSLSEHMLATYVGGIFGEHSIFIHIISIAVVIAVLIPVRQKLERAIERFFAKKTVEF